MMYVWGYYCLNEIFEWKILHVLEQNIKIYKIINLKIKIKYKTFNTRIEKS